MTYTPTLKSPEYYEALMDQIDLRFGGHGPVRGTSSGQPIQPEPIQPAEKKREVIFKLDPGMKRTKGEKIVTLRNYGTATCCVCGVEFMKQNYNAMTCTPQCSRKNNGIRRKSRPRKKRADKATCPHLHWQKNGVGVKTRVPREICAACGTTRNAGEDS